MCKITIKTDAVNIRYVHGICFYCRYWKLSEFVDMLCKA